MRYDKLKLWDAGPAYLFSGELVIFVPGSQTWFLFSLVIIH